MKLKIALIVLGVAALLVVIFHWKRIVAKAKRA